MRKFSILFILLCFCISFQMHAQCNYAQELVDLLHQEKYFEAIDLKKQHADQLPKNDKAFDLIYNIHMSLAFNKPDSAIVYLEEFLNNPDYVRILGPIVGAYYPMLSRSYEDKQQYGKSIDTAEKYLKYLAQNPFSLDQELIKNETNDANKRITLLKDKLENEPLRRIVRDQKVQDIKLKDSEYIRFDAKYNGHEIETLFNTDVGRFFLIEEELANEIGVRISSNQDGNPPILVNGVLDSIELKGVKLYNIPVTILKGKFSIVLPNDINIDLKTEIESKIFKKRQIIMGVSAMKMIGRFDFDWKSNVLRLPPEQMSVKKKPSPNFMLLKNIPYLNLKINDINFTGLLDTSSKHFIYLTAPYMISNSNSIIAETQEDMVNRASFLGYDPNVKRLKIKKPQISFDGKNIDNKNLDVYEANPIGTKWNVFDGEVGVDFIKKTGSKTLVDFDTMMIKITD